jgi:hypothetical protein
MTDVFNINRGMALLVPTIYIYIYIIFLIITLKSTSPSLGNAPPHIF